MIKLYIIKYMTITSVLKSLNNFLIKKSTNLLLTLPYLY